MALYAMNTHHSSVSHNPQKAHQFTPWDRKQPQSATLVVKSDCSIPHTTTNSAQPESPIPHFAVAKTRRIGYFQNTPDFQERAEKAKKEAMKVAPEQLRIKTVSEALDLWWEHVKEPAVRKPRTKEAYLLYMGHLKRKIGSTVLCEINIGHVLEYQRERHKVEGASTWLTNHETNTLSQVMRYADLWDRIEKYFRQLPPPDWTPPKVMTVEEEEFFFKIAAANPLWEVAYWTCSLTNNTSAVGCELTNLQKKHILISKDPKIPSVLHVPDGKVKNEFRARVIPLNETALKQIERIVERAEKLAKIQGFTQLYEEHYIFPRGVARNRFDVTKPASRYFIYNHFYKMRKLTGFKWLCPRNFRNQIITKLFERGTPDETITSIAGHSSIKMSRYYSRIRVTAKFEALSAISPVGKGVKNAS